MASFFSWIGCAGFYVWPSYTRSGQTFGRPLSLDYRYDLTVTMNKGLLTWRMRKTESWKSYTNWRRRSSHSPRLYVKLVIFARSSIVSFVLQRPLPSTLIKDPKWARKMWLISNRAGTENSRWSRNIIGVQSPIWFLFSTTYRHPLQEQTVDTFVPNDILIVGGAVNGSYPAVHGEGDDLMSEEGSVRGNSVVICTGANSCGKVKTSRSRFSFSFSRNFTWAYI